MIWIALYVAVGLGIAPFATAHWHKQDEPTKWAYADIEGYTYAAGAGSAVLWPAFLLGYIYMMFMRKVMTHKLTAPRTLAALADIGGGSDNTLSLLNNLQYKYDALKNQYDSLANAVTTGGFGSSPGVSATPYRTYTSSITTTTK